MEYGELAQRADMSQSSAHRYLNKADLAIPLTALADLCAGLDIDLLDLVKRAQDGGE
ncbi:helix-turn-helix domain-containing protein [Nesterenkonia massiliensis]|uniref:helix-turn-helix domain-containing protein n=1 Tax=Nesterenkonia massiliensis TaxID=1232429 RepID=UPI003B8A76E4